jgi:hypothetical protein
VTGPTGLRRFLEPPVATPAGPPTAGPQTVVAKGGVPQGDGEPEAGPKPERCEMCATEVSAEHSHVADLEQSSLMCVCRA